MRAKHLPVIATFLAASALPMAPSRADSVETHPYYVGPGWMAMLPSCNLGAVCLDPHRGRRVAITVDDVSGLPVVGLAMFEFGDDWAARKITYFCGSTGPIDVPPGATSLTVHVGLTSDGFPDSWGFAEGVCGRAVKGTISGRFTS